MSFSKLSSLILILASQIYPSYGLTTTNCPLAGPVFPKLSQPSQNKIIQTALQSLTTIISDYDAYAQFPFLSYQNSYSAQVFSANEELPLWDHSHTAWELPLLNSSGQTNVTGDTVYRLGSVSKIFTIYTFLIEDGFAHFNDPITKWVPELAAIAASGAGNTISQPDWEEITIGALASQMAGIANENALSGELSVELPQVDDIAIGFPPLSAPDIPTCGIYPLCNRTQFFQNFPNVYPVEAAYSTPIYSNVAYQILAYALEGITGKNFASMLQDDLVTPLSLNHTFYSSMPDVSYGIIPGDVSSTEWNVNLGEEAPTGGIYTSANDMSRLGRSILSSRLMLPSVTRRWLKPVALTSDLRAAVSYPWGIRRISLTSNQYRIIDAYNKAGNIGSYSSLLILIPDYNIGMVLLFAGTSISNVNFAIANVIGDTLLSAFEDAGRQNAQELYAGTWSSADANISSSITISTDPLGVKPGLGIDRWISNGTDMFPIIISLLGLSSTTESLSIRLYPTDLNIRYANGTQKQSFRAVFEDLNTPTSESTFTTPCGTWIGPAGFMYGRQQLDEFIFMVDANGNATSLLNSALRLEMRRGVGAGGTAGAATSARVSNFTLPTPVAQILPAAGP